MTQHPIIIGLTGPAGSGKDTVADLLVTHCGFHKMAFADALKAEVCEAFGVEPLYLTHRDTKEHAMSCLALARCNDQSFIDCIVAMHWASNTLIDPNAPRSPRQIMQWWGTDYRRKQWPNYWVSQLTHDLCWPWHGRQSTHMVITDLRFNNEADMVTRHGGTIWQITRPGCGVAPGAHVSETTGEAFAPSAVLHNTHDIAHLQHVVLHALDAHQARRHKSIDTAQS